MPKIIITDARHSRSLPIMINGQRHDIPVGVETEVSKDEMEVLTNSSIAFDVVGAGAARSGVAKPSPKPSANVSAAAKAASRKPRKARALGGKTSPPGKSEPSLGEEMAEKQAEDGRSQKAGGDGNSNL